MRIAISGTIGSGKSSISNILKEKGFEVFDLDKINAKLQTKNNKGYNELIKHFDGILNDDLEIDKKALAKQVFSDVLKLNELNNIMHPLIKEEMLECFKGKEFVICEVPLLFETDFYKLFDYYLIVVTDEKIACERLKKRGFSKEEAMARIKNQMSVELKKQRASYIIENNGDLKALEEKVDKWLGSVKLC